MLERLLAEVRSGGTLEVRALAVRLETTPGLVEAMLEHLERSGLLRTHQPCGQACGGCSLRDACRAAPPANGVRLWRD